MGFMTLNDELVVGLGKVAAGGGLIENQMRRVAAALAVQVDPASTFAENCKAVVELVNTYGVPIWSRTTPRAVLDWCRKARERQFERNYYLHSEFYMKKSEAGDMVTYFRPANGKRGERLLKAEKLDAEAAKMRGVIEECWQLHAGLLPKLAKQVVVSCLPPDVPASAVVYYEDGWPAERPLDEDVARLGAAFDQICRELSPLQVGYPFSGPDVTDTDLELKSKAFHNELYRRMAALASDEPAQPGS